MSGRHTFNPDIMACLNELRGICDDDLIGRALIGGVGHRRVSQGILAINADPVHRLYAIREPCLASMGSCYRSRYRAITCFRVWIRNSRRRRRSADMYVEEIED